MKYSKIFLTIFACALFSICRADCISDFANYKAGDTTKWFHSMRVDSFKKGKAKEIQKQILSVLSEKSVSDEAFRLACIILKPIATDDAVLVLTQDLYNPKRVASVCDVFQALNSSASNEALKSSLLRTTSLDCAMAIVNALASNGQGQDAVVSAANGNFVALQKYATLSLSRFSSNSAIKALEAIIKADDSRKENALLALCSRAYRDFSRGRINSANRALESVPLDFAMSVAVRGLISDDITKFCDKVISSDEKLSKFAGRAISGKRDLKSSADMLKNFGKLSPKAKTIVIGSMIPTNDSRYWQYVSPCMDSKCPDLRDEAIYSARFLCGDEADMVKIYNLAKSGNKLAKVAIIENPRYVADKVLRDRISDTLALEFLCLRGDKTAETKLLDKFFKQGGYADAKVCSSVERLIDFSNVKDFATKMKGEKNVQLRDAIAKIVIKVMASASKSGTSREFLKKFFDETLGANLEPSNKYYQLALKRFKLAQM